MTVLETDRQHVRQWEPDAAALLRPVTDPRVLHFIGNAEPWSDAMAKRIAAATVAR